MLYARNFVMAMSAKDVIGAEVDDDRMTCKKGCNSAVVSKALISVPYERLPIL